MRVFLILLSLLVTLPAQAGEMHRIRVNGVERTYYLHLPTPRMKAGLPLVIMLHGATADGRNDVRRYGWEHWADSHDFVIAGPDAPTLKADEPVSDKNFRTWNHGSHKTPSNVTATDDVGFMVAMIDEIASAHRIDRRRVYIAGFSSGGSMAHRLGTELSGHVAAIVAAAGGLPPKHGRPARGMPILITAGDRDPVTPVEGGSQFVEDSHRVIIDKWRALDDCPAARRLPSAPDLLIEVAGPCRDGSEVKYIRMIGVEHEWPRTKQIDLTEVSWDFFKRFSLPAAAVKR
ncbi:MAG: alpha/beta fold hydrolase [Alphaproteobacteria bacterium]|nr:alpha/beta fold hydrolase [Alphaproteobacteria bacterium]